MKRNNLLLSVLSVVVLGGALVGCNDTPPVITHELTLDTTNVKTNYKLGESFEVTGLVANYVTYSNDVETDNVTLNLSDLDFSVEIGTKFETVQEDYKVEVTYEDSKAEYLIDIAALTVTDKINNSLGNIKFLGEAYKELYSEDGVLGTTLEGPMMSLFTSGSYHWEAKGEFDDFDGGESTLWHEDGKVYLYQYTLQNEVVKVEAKYDDGTAVDWNDFINPMNLIKDATLVETEGKVNFDLTTTENMQLACDFVERIAWWQFEELESLTLTFNDYRITNVTFRTTMTNDKFQDCVYGASLDVVSYGEECEDYPIPEPYEMSDEKKALETALKEVDANNFVATYLADLGFYTVEGNVFKNNNCVFYEDLLDPIYSMGAVKIDNKWYELGYDFEGDRLARLSSPIEFSDSTEEVTLEDVMPLFSYVSAAFFEIDAEDSNKFIVSGEPAYYFGGMISRCGLSQFDTTPISSDPTEVILQDGKVDKIDFYSYGSYAGTYDITQLGGDITLPFEIESLPVVDAF